MANISSNPPRPASANDAKHIEIPSSSTTNRDRTQRVGASPEAHENSQVAPSPEALSADGLLGALWRSADRFHQLGSLNRQTNKFKNLPVKDVADAVRQALQLSSAGHEVYFACAEYLTPDSRAAVNAFGACGFWLDIDCGEGKAASSKCYPTIAAAIEALRLFCKDAGLPPPTHTVNSGGGLHPYWVVSKMIDREEWQARAKMFKDVAKACEFFADPSRTADIASVLRVPGTLNHKYSPPRPVSLIYATDETIEQSVMLDAIAAAHSRLCSAVANKPINRPASFDTTAAAIADTETIGIANGAKYGPLDLSKLASALAMLDPDCDEETWKLKRLAPLALAAHDHPDLVIELYELARSWSRGQLRGEPSVAWVTPGGTGRTGEEVFDEVWDRFMNTHYTGTPVTLGTIFFDARQAGWTPTDSFEGIDDGGDA